MATLVKAVLTLEHGMLTRTSTRGKLTPESQQSNGVSHFSRSLSADRLELTRSSDVRRLTVSVTEARMPRHP